MSSGFCKQHPTYWAVHPPKADCEDCRIAYEREWQKCKIVGRAARELSTLLGVNVTITVDYERPGIDDTGFCVYATVV